MKRPEIEKSVLAEYKKLYPKWKNVQITEVISDTFGGDLAVVRATTDEGHPNEEVCFVYPEGTVRIFSTTEELARFLELKAKAPFIERIFSRPVFTGMVFVFLLIAVFFIGFTPKDSFRPEVLTMLGSVLGGAAGFFFGSGKVGK